MARVPLISTQGGAVAKSHDHPEIKIPRRVRADRRHGPAGLDAQDARHHAERMRGVDESRAIGCIPRVLKPHQDHMRNGRSGRGCSQAGAEQKRATNHYGRERHGSHGPIFFPFTHPHSITEFRANRVLRERFRARKIRPRFRKNPPETRPRRFRLTNKKVLHLRKRRPCQSRFSVKIFFLSEAK